MTKNRTIIITSKVYPFYNNFNTKQCNTIQYNTNDIWWKLNGTWLLPFESYNFSLFFGYNFSLYFGFQIFLIFGFQFFPVFEF